MDKTHITPVRTKASYFLGLNTHFDVEIIKGYKIEVTSFKTSKNYIIKSKTIEGKNYKKRINHGLVKLYTDRVKVLKNLHNKGFIEYDHNKEVGQKNYMWTNTRI